MEELTPHLPVLCPQCHKPTVHTTFGDVCASCNLVLQHPIGAKEQTTNAPSPNLAIDPLPPAPAPAASMNQPAPVTVQQAIRFRHRLKERMRRLVVPELPGSLSQPAIDSPLREATLPKPHDSTIHTTPPRNSAPYPTVPLPTQAPSDREEDRSSQAFRLAEEIAETDSGPGTSRVPLKPGGLANVTPAEQPAPSTTLKNNQKLLLGGTMIAIVLIFMVGVWAAQRNAPVNTPQPTPQSNNPSSRKPSKPSPEAAQRDAQRKTDLTSLATALEVYKREIGTYPAGSDISVVYALQYTTPPYISYINYDPSSDAETKIKYSYTSDSSSFTLAARLEDPTDPDNQNGYYIVKSQ